MVETIIRWSVMALQQSFARLLSRTYRLKFDTSGGAQSEASQLTVAQRRGVGREHHTIGNMRRKISCLFVALLATLPSATGAQVLRSDEHSFQIVQVVEGLQQPWSLAFLPDGRMLVTEKAGRLRIISDGKLHPQPVEGTPEVTVHGQGGLHDVVLHPDFKTNQLVYLAYAASGSDGVGTELARGRLVGNRLEGVEVVFRQTPKGRAGQHFGGRIVFDREGYLYLTLGDRGERERAQRPDDHAGSVIRLHDDGRVPKDNPFVGRNGWKPEKFTLGNRNMQGAGLHPQTGQLWTHEHGPQGGDEINVIRAGRNYGWPVITYGVNYGIGTKIGEGTSKQGLEQPLYYWVPSIAPSGMTFYTGERFPRWKGNLFVGALRDQMLVRLQLDGEKVVKEERLLKGVLGRIRDVRMGPDGYLYLLNDASNGVLARLEPAS
jgi:glucose/arabinose dehydrogenase